MPTTLARSSEHELLCRVIEESFRRETWGGENLTSVLRGVDAGEASWRPPNAAHRIADIVLHCAYWKYVIVQRIRGDRTRDFPIPGRDWLEHDGDLSQGEWDGHIKLLRKTHKSLLDTVNDPELAFTFETDEGRKQARRAFGVALHDEYHAGQIALIRAQYRRSVKACSAHTEEAQT